MKKVFLLFTVNVVKTIKKIFKEETSIEILKFLHLITNIEEYQKKYIIRSEENISQEFRLKI